MGNKIPSVSSLFKKKDYDARITEIEKKLTDHNHDKHITTLEFNILAASVFNARLAQANLTTKTGFDAKLSSLNKKITSNKAKYLLGENELKTFDSSYFRGTSHFEEDGMQKYLVFQSMTRYLRMNTSTNQIVQWKSKGLSDKAIKILSSSSNFFEPLLNYYGTKIRLKFNESILKQVKLHAIMEK